MTEDSFEVLFLSFSRAQLQIDIPRCCSLPFDLGGVVGWGVLFQPSKNLFSILIWRKYWIENLFNLSRLDNQGQSLVQIETLNAESRKSHGAL
jgi:hypothetical protein